MAAVQFHHDGARFDDVTVNGTAFVVYHEHQRRTDNDDGHADAFDVDKYLDQFDIDDRGSVIHDVHGRSYNDWGDAVHCSGQWRWVRQRVRTVLRDVRGA